MRSLMQIDSILPNRVSPGQSVIIQGDGLEAAVKVLVGDQEVAFEIDGETLVVEIPDISGEVDVTVQGADSESDTSSITIE
jgi:IPT/TIG domain